MNILELGLQIFTEGASASIGGGDMGSTSGAFGVDGTTASDSSQVAYGNEGNDLSASFNEMINGEYKDVAQKWLKDKLGRRMKGKDAKIQEYEDKMGRMSPAMEKLAIKYGVNDPNDIDSILSAIDEDNSYFEEYAYEHGVTTDQAKTLIQAERIQRENDAREEQARVDAEFNEWYQGKLQEAEQLKQYYPAFDFDKESNDEITGEKFRNWVQIDGISLRDAYEMVHKEDIMSGAMAYAMNQMRNEQADNRTSRRMRPSENGTMKQQAATFNDSMSGLSPQDMKKINDAVKSGYRVTKENFRKFL